MVRIVQSNFYVKKQENMGIKSKVVTWVWKCSTKVLNSVFGIKGLVISYKVDN